jgi:cell division protease FtsH
VEVAYQRVKQLLTEKIESVKTIAEELLKKEVLYKDDLDRLIGARPYEDPPISEGSMEPTPPLPGSVAPQGNY